jgi:phage terminase large subunit
LSILTVDVPRVFEPLLASRRYKGAHGGRGAAKSHFFAQQLVLHCYAQAKRAVCIREVQNSIRQSVRLLIIDKIADLGLGGFFTVLEQEIRGSNGSLIIFRGMQAYNAENIKSLEDYDIAWVEEAQSFSERSLRLLRPTIRKLGSEIWFSWNPRHETDAVDRFFRGGKPRDDAALVAVHWNDNPWFPEVLRKEKDSDYAADPEMAEHVWGGGYERVSEASYYGRLIALAEKEGRIGDFPYDPRRPVKTAWDIGIDDYTSIWFIQDDGIFPTVVDYYEATDFFAQDIVKDAFPELGVDKAEAFLKRKEIGRAQPFFYAEHFMPHDVKHREWGAGRTRPLTLMALGIKPIHVGAALGPAERINAVRQILPITRFNRTPRVMLGISRLRRYSRKLNVEMGTYVGPLHDINSHGADAFGEYALNCHFIPRFEKPEARAPRRGTVFLPGPPESRSSKRIAT